LCTKYKNDALAGEIIDLGLKQIPQSSRLLVQKGITLEKLGKREESEKIFSSALRMQKDHSVALAGLAITQMISNELAEALKTLAAGSEEFPQDFYIHYLYAYALERSAAVEGESAKITEEAKQNLEKAIKLNPSFAQSYYSLGKLYVHTNPNLAIANFETALRLDPTDLSAKYQLARLYMKAGNQKDGQRLMAEVEKEKADKLVEERRPQITVVEQ
jgi:tetratricopeptide (TPR) repeat protein